MTTIKRLNTRLNKGVRPLIIVLISILSIAACTLNDPKLSNNIDPIEAALNSDIAKNKYVSNQPSGKIPSAVTNALLPAPSLSSTALSNNEDQQRFDIAVNNVPAKDFFTGLVKGTKYNMTVNPQVTGMVSLDLKGVTVQEVMDAARDTFGYEYRTTPHGFQVMPRALETRIFNVNYLNMDRGGTSQTSFGTGEITQIANQSSSSFVSGATSSQQVTPSGNVSTESHNDFWKELKTNLIAIIGDKDGRNIVVNPQGGVVIVKAFPDELRDVASYLDEIQSNLGRQVIIEAQILEVQLNAQYQSGINWKILGVSEGPHVFGNSANALATAEGLEPITNIPQDFSNVFTLKAYGGDDLQTFIELLNTQGRVHTLSNPRVSTTNNQKAVIKVGNDRFFVTNVSNNSVTGTTTSNTQNITLTPFFSGIALDVTPQIDDEDNITLHIHPIVSNVTLDRQQFVVNGSNEDLPLAQSSIRESDSVVHAKSGQIIVIGGLMQNQMTSDEASTPGTENWGPISGLFKSANKTAQKFELVILLRPIITNTHYNWNKMLKETAQRYENMKGDFRYNLGKADPNANKKK